ncbi:uncharacterized protein [Dermacentor albipictus]|uniref:uncharacterized protein n=1 Tax=Dermacentor albipictus TaxID=60249 RepID=UPI0038FBFE77
MQPPGYQLSSYTSATTRAGSCFWFCPWNIFQRATSKRHLRTHRSIYSSSPTTATDEESQQGCLHRCDFSDCETGKPLCVKTHQGPLRVKASILFSNYPRVTAFI